VSNEDVAHFIVHHRGETQANESKGAEGTFSCESAGGSGCEGYGVTSRFFCARLIISPSMLGQRSRVGGSFHKLLIQFLQM
jgi:hypothetical protein